MAKPKLLVIDDEPAFTQLIVEYFKVHGFEVSVANNVEDALKQYRRHQPPVVLLDFNMPLVNGDKFLPLLQDMNPLVRVIVVSGCTEEEVEEKFRGLGYFGFFEKGALSLDKLREKVDEALAY
jgi:DNA-binding NtrC family response regulator